MKWRDIEYEELPLTDPRLSAVIEAVESKLGNGDVIFRIFRPIDEASFDLAWRLDLQGIEHPLRCFLEARSVRDIVPELGIPDPLPCVPKHIWYSGFEFEGAVTRLLLSDGVYDRSTLSEGQARTMAREFVDALAGPERLQTVAFRIDEAWTDWFYNFPLDLTFIVLQIPVRRWAMLCVTDAD